MIAQHGEPVDEPSQTEIAAISRYTIAMHAVQTGVAIEHSQGSDDGSPKHLRVGVNSALIVQSALATLLIEAGVFTREQYASAVADAAEAEANRYESRLGVSLA